MSADEEARPRTIAEVLAELAARKPDPVDQATLIDLVKRGVLMGVEVFGGMDDEDWGYGLCDRFSEHAVGSDCNRADEFLLRPSDPEMTDALRAAIHDEGPWAAESLPVQADGEPTS